MKRFSFILLFFGLFHLAGISQGIEWERSFGDSGSQGNSSHHLEMDSLNYYFGGWTNSTNSGEVNGIFSKVRIYKDSSVHYWTREFGKGGTDDLFSDIARTSDNGFLLVGQTESPGIPGYHGQEDVWVVMADSMGGLKWQKAYGGSASDVGGSVLKVDGGRYLIFGSSSSSDGDLDSNYGSYDVWAFMIDSNGNMLWEKNYGGTDVEGMAEALKVDEGYFFTASARSDSIDVSSNKGEWDYWLVKLDSTGSIEWERSYGGTYGDKPADVVRTEDEGYAITGYTQSEDWDVGYAKDKMDFWTIKVDSSGNLEWEIALGGNEGDRGKSIDQTSDGGFILTGTTFSPDIPTDPCPQNPDIGTSTMLTIKLDSDGDSVEWSRCSGGSNGDAGAFNKELPNGDILISGTTSSNDLDVSHNHGGHDAWVAELDTALPIMTSSEDWGLHPKKSVLDLYPNPFREKLSVEFGKEGEGRTHFTVFDKMGRKIREGKRSGQRFRIDLSGRSSGIYLIKVRRGSRVRTEKVVKE